MWQTKTKQEVSCKKQQQQMAACAGHAPLEHLARTHTHSAAFYCHLIFLHSSGVSELSALPAQAPIIQTRLLILGFCSFIGIFYPGIGFWGAPIHNVERRRKVDALAQWGEKTGARYPPSSTSLLLRTASIVFALYFRLRKKY